MGLHQFSNPIPHDLIIIITDTFTDIEADFQDEQNTYNIKFLHYYYYHYSYFYRNRRRFQGGATEHSISVSKQSS